MLDLMNPRWAERWPGHLDGFWITVERQAWRRTLDQW
jgi:hypothetical protein